MNMESAPHFSQEETENKFNEQKFVQAEDGFLEKVSGKARTVARALALFTTLSGAPVVAQEIHTENKPTTVESTQTHAVEKIDESKLTESSKWSKSVVESFKTDMTKIKTADDANMLVKIHLNHFISEYNFPTVGNLKEGSYGMKTREYSEEDLKLLLQKSNEIKDLFQGVHKKFTIVGFDNYLANLNGIIQKLEYKASYAGKGQEELMRRFEGILDQKQ